LLLVPLAGGLPLSGGGLREAVDGFSAATGPDCRKPQIQMELQHMRLGKGDS